MNKELIKEIWREIPGFSNYEISDFGNVFNIERNMRMRTSVNNFEHMKISLVDDDGVRHTRSVAQMVAEAFVEPPNILCDHVVVKDGDFNNVVAENLMWRPRGFAWRYKGQLKRRVPLHYKNLPVIDVTTGDRYNSIISAGMQEGLLFDDIWRSTYTGAAIFPTGGVFEIINRV